ncbi:MAG: HTH-type transcriptional activator RhaR [Verrucomicrobiae bacterium]|nr:HTH-type transcriptional activator RhaR [Verrucomicrobiae bacterium]
MTKPFPHARRSLFETRLGLRLLYCGRFVCQPDWFVAPERLPREFISFFFLEKNNCWYIVNGRRGNLTQGELLTVRGGDLISLGHDPRHPITALSLSIAIEQGPVPNLLLQRRFARRYRLNDPLQYTAKFNAILDGLQSPLAVRDWAVASPLLAWCIHLLAETGAPLSAASKPGQADVDRILTALTWANARLETVITLAQWAKVTGWHPVHFGHVFKQETGLPPMRWLEERRLGAARQYLAGTSKSVAEIAAAVGYPDPFYFSRVFRRHFGHPPLRYRRLALGAPGHY